LAALTPEQKHVTPLLRVLTSLCKAYVSKKAIALMYSCMEALGGLGYLLNEETEYMNLARLYRDCCVLSIWEGTTNVLSTDFLRAIKHPQSGAASVEALDVFIRANAGPTTDGTSGTSGTWSDIGDWDAVKKALGQAPQEELIGDAQKILWTVADVLVSVLLGIDSRSDGSGWSRDVYEQFAGAKMGDANARGLAGPKRERTLARDLAIVYGDEGSKELMNQAKL
jgi:hypothetical protein